MFLLFICIVITKEKQKKNFKIWKQPCYNKVLCWVRMPFGQNIQHSTFKNIMCSLSVIKCKQIAPKKKCVAKRKRSRQHRDTDQTISEIIWTRYEFHLLHIYNIYIMDIGHEIAIFLKQKTNNLRAVCLHLCLVSLSFSWQKQQI